MFTCEDGPQANPKGSQTAIQHSKCETQPLKMIHLRLLFCRQRATLQAQRARLEKSRAIATVCSRHHPLPIFQYYLLAGVRMGSKIRLKLFPVTHLAAARLHSLSKNRALLPPNPGIKTAAP